MVLPELKKKPVQQFTSVDTAFDAPPTHVKLADLPVSTQACLTAYGEVETVDCLSGGSSTPYKVQFRNHSEPYVIKTFDNQYDEISLRLGLRFILYLDSRSIPVPKVTPTIRGELLNTQRIGDSCVKSIAMRFVSGQPVSMSETNALIEMAGYQAAMHNAGIEFAATDPVRPRKHRSMLSLLLRHVVPQGYSHFDYDQSNVMAKHGRVISIIDFDGIRYGPIIVCLIYTLTKLREGGANSTTIADYIRTYRTVRRLNILELSLMRAALLF